jgi:excisionase family DNA binding protein
MGLNNGADGGEPAPLKVNEVARRLGVTPTAIYELIHRGQLGHLRVGTAYRIPVECFEEFWRKNLHRV